MKRDKEFEKSDRNSTFNVLWQELPQTDDTPEEVGEFISGWGQPLPFDQYQQESDEQLNQAQEMEVDYETTAVMTSEEYSGTHGEWEPYVAPVDAQKPFVELPPFQPLKPQLRFHLNESCAIDVSPAQLQVVIQGIDAFAITDTKKPSAVSADDEFGLRSNAREEAEEESELKLPTMSPQLNRKKHGRDSDDSMDNNSSSEEEKRKGRKALKTAQIHFNLKRKAPEPQSKECKDPRPSFWKKDFDPKDPEDEGPNNSASEGCSFLRSF